ncbi:MAG TPA: glycoside hydrolase family 16 protein [Fimbriimonadaceae bacterium]|jgi:beta-glucanase (GH16 family)
MLIPILLALSLGHGKLVFEQDFSKVKTLDPKVWIFNDGPVYNNEAEKYTNQAAGNAYISNGELVLEARKTGDAITSARLESRQSWKYGYFEISAKVPEGRGTWPAFWMLSNHIKESGANFVKWPDCGEIDIMENVGYDPGKFHFSLHCEDFNWMKKQQRTETSSTDAPYGWHTFALDWRADHITFLMDGKPEYEVTKDNSAFSAWPFDYPYFIILNLAVGGNWGGSKGIDPKMFPARYEIRYLRIYE